MEPVRIHARRRSQPGGQWNGPTQTGGKTTPPAFGAHRQGPETSSMAAARGAFKCQGPRRRAHRSPA
eukprot:1245501-Prymnesium_polylepis.1